MQGNYFFFSSKTSIRLLVLFLFSSIAVMADETVSKSAVHIVYTEQPPQNEQPESFHIRTLTTVLGSEEAAREALVYSYKNAASGFSAKLTPEQVSEISKQPGVLQVVPSRVYQLHTGIGTGTARIH